MRPVALVLVALLLAACVGPSAEPSIGSLPQVARTFLAYARFSDPWNATLAAEGLRAAAYNVTREDPREAFGMREGGYAGAVDGGSSIVVSFHFWGDEKPIAYRDAARRLAEDVSAIQRRTQWSLLSEPTWEART